MHRFVVFVAVFAITTLFIFTIKPSANEPQHRVSIAQQPKPADSGVASAVLSNLRAKAHYHNTSKSDAALSNPLSIQRKQSYQPE